MLKKILTIAGSDCSGGAEMCIRDRPGSSLRLRGTQYVRSDDLNKFRGGREMCIRDRYYSNMRRLS